MASITELAQMYRQRIAPSGMGSRVPTTTTAGKTGPRQTTVNDVRRVAQYGRSAMTPSYASVDPRPGGLSSAPTPFSMPQTALQDIQAGIIGGPGAGYGEKYGGFPTQSDYLNAIKGEAFGTRELAALARQRAEQAIANRETEYVPPVSAELSRSASMAGVRPGALVSEADRAKLMGGYERVQEFGRGPEYQAARERGSYQGYSPNDLMRMAYESMLGAPEMTPEQQRTAADIAVQEEVNLPGTQRYGQFLQSAEVEQPRQMADLIEQTPLSEYARQIAQARYGMDPALAAGLFGPKMDMDYAKLQDDYDRFNRGFVQLSDAEYIFDNYGPEAYDQYRQARADAALFGSESEQRSALNQQIEEENLETDLQIEENYGFRPSMVSGQDTETVRQAFYDTNFQDAVDLAVKKFQEGGLDDSAAEGIIRDYLANSGGSMSAPVNAQVLESIIATFNTSFFDFG
jgi:hypothetical protein